MLASNTLPIIRIGASVSFASLDFISILLPNLTERTKNSSSDGLGLAQDKRSSPTNPRLFFFPKPACERQLPQKRGYTVPIVTNVLVKCCENCKYLIEPNLLTPF